MKGKKREGNTVTEIMIGNAIEIEGKRIVIMSVLTEIVTEIRDEETETVIVIEIEIEIAIVIESVRIDHAPALSVTRKSARSLHPPVSSETLRKGGR